MQGFIKLIDNLIQWLFISKHSIYLASGRRDRWTVEPSETAEHIFHNIIISNILGCNCLLTEQKLMWMILYDWLLDLPLYIKVGKRKQTKAQISLKNRDGGYFAFKQYIKHEEPSCFTT